MKCVFAEVRECGDYCMKTSAEDKRMILKIFTF